MANTENTGGLKTLMIVDTLVTSHLMAVCSKFLLQRRTTLGRLADGDCIRVRWWTN